MKVQVSSIIRNGKVVGWKVKKIYPWGVIEAICDNPGRLNDGTFDHKVNHLWNKFIHEPTPKNMAILLKAYRRWRKRMKNLNGVKLLKAIFDLDEKMVEAIKKYPPRKKRVKRFRRRIIRYVDENHQPVLDDSGNQLTETVDEEVGEEEVDTLEDAVTALHREVCEDPDLSKVYKPRPIPETKIVERIEEEKKWEEKSQQT